MVKTPYRWQKEAFEKFKNAVCFMLNVCCGGGKTVVAIWIAIHKKLPVIIIAPNTICEQWKEDLMAEGIEEKDIWVHNQPTYSRNKEKYKFEVMLWLQS